jgi:hypothetical protein
MEWILPIHWAIQIRETLAVSTRACNSLALASNYVYAVCFISIDRVAAPRNPSISDAIRHERGRGHGDSSMFACVRMVALNSRVDR